MKKDQNIHGNPEVRKLAEKVQLKEKDISTLSDKEKEYLIHELLIHQIELQMQNDELHRIQLELQASRDKYSDLYDFAPISYFSINGEGTIIEVNLVGAEMLGMKRSLLIGSLFSNFVSKETQDVFYFHREKLLETKTRQICELKLIRDDGSSLDVRLESVVGQDDEGSSPAFRVAVSDITARKEMEESVRKIEERYRELDHFARMMADNVPDLIWAKDMAYRYIFTNIATCGILLNAKDTNEPVGKPQAYFAERERKAHPENPYWYDFGEQDIDSDSIVMRTRESKRFEEEGHVKGEYICLDVYKAPFLDDQGDQIGIVGCARDVTKEKVLEKELQKLNEELKQRVADLTSEVLAAHEQHSLPERLAAAGELAGAVAHEVNSPLQAVTVLLKILRDRRTDDVELMKALDVLSRAFENIRDTVKNLTNLSRSCQGIETANRRKHPFEIVR